MRRKILRGFLVMVAMYGALAAFVLGAVYLASGITPTVLHVNYDSIQAANEMRESLTALRMPRSFPQKSPTDWVKQFDRALTFEETNITEKGEAELVRQVRVLWDVSRKTPQVVAGAAGAAADADFRKMHELLKRIVLVNEEGMFEMASESTALRTRALAIGGLIFFIALLVAIFQADSLASRVANPLKDIAEALRTKPLPGEKLKLPVPTSLELRVLTHEMGQMWKRLSELRAINVEELSTQRKKLDLVLESVEDAILVVDGYGTVVQCNEGMAKIVGLPMGSVTGHKWNDLATAGEGYLKLRDTLSPEMPPDAVVELSIEKESRVYTARCRNIIAKDGDRDGLIYLLHDVTERKRRDRLKAEFIAVLSHELKTPLQSLGTASELLLKRKAALDEDGRMLVDTVHEDVERIRAVAQDFIQVSFVEPNSLKLKLTKHALSELVQEWIKPFRLVARDKNVKLDFVRTGSEIIWASLDPVKFPWAISNLLSNAIRFSPTDSKVTVAIDDRKERIEIEIRDEGPGIPEGMRVKMFDPYFQVPANQATGPSGFLGLGLTIAKELVEAHGGDIEYAPGSPRGSIFRILLPKVDGIV